MARHDLRNLDDILKAIKGSGGILTTVAQKLGVNWHTAQKYVNKYAAARAAFDDECQVPLDVAESIILKNLSLAMEQQKRNGEVVDASDAKWYLTMRGKQRGYANRAEVSGPGGGPVELTIVERIVTRRKEDYDDSAGEQ